MENPLTLNMLVPVSNTVPVNLTVPADYPLNQTELPEPFLRLQNVLSPYINWMASIPDSWREMYLCDGPRDKICSWLFGSQ